MADYSERTSPGRLSGFSHAPYRAATRAQQARPIDDPRLLEVASRAQAQAAREPIPDNLHSWGVAQVLIREWNGAIETLDAAARQRPQDAGLLNDLAVAYIGRGTGEARAEDFRKALEAADRALAVDAASHEALFNRGVALDALGRTAEAQAAFRALLERDRSTWRDEVERRLGTRPAKR
jgi:tetratricopeptide (TPR) repeat protein